MRSVVFSLLFGKQSQLFQLFTASSIATA